MAEPPSLEGAVQLTASEVPDRVAVTAVGAPGTAAGVTAVDAVEYAELPAELVARTRKMYEVPLVSPVTVADVVERLLEWVVQLVPESDE